MRGKRQSNGKAVNPNGCHPWNLVAKVLVLRSCSVVGGVGGNQLGKARLYHAAGMAGLRVRIRIAPLGAPVVATGTTPQRLRQLAALHPSRYSTR